MDELGFGVFVHPMIPEGRRADQRFYEEVLDLVREAEKLGYQNFFFAEHHFTRLGGNPSQGAMIGAACRVTSRIRIGALAYVIPIRNPLHLAEEIALLDNLCAGRLDVGFTSGISEFELRELGVEPKWAKEASREATNAVLEFLRSGGRIFNFEGERFKYREVESVIQFVQRPYPPVWIPTRTVPTSIWAAQNGLNIVTGLDRDEVMRERIEAYKQNYSGPGSPKLAIQRNALISGSEERLERLLPQALRQYSASFLDLPMKKGIGKPKIGAEVRDSKSFEAVDFARYSDPEYVLGNNLMWIGKPEEVVKMASRSLQVTGANYVIVEVDWPSLDHQDLVDTLSLFSLEVIPALMRK
jgi:alkanesulfonate monooxygenase SsuD/methylene tetrahydromethanopterin reductase-like flavin-dependent oxidoreductase (luciferase family)